MLIVVLFAVPHFNDLQVEKQLSSSPYSTHLSMLCGEITLSTLAFKSSLGSLNLLFDISDLSDKEVQTLKGCKFKPRYYVLYHKEHEGVLYKDQEPQTSQWGGIVKLTTPGL